MNPIQVLVRAVENAAPCEEVTVVEYGGIRHPKAVDVAPQRRVDLALRWITQGSFQAAAKGKANIVSTLTSEIISANENDTKSFAVSKRNEVERQAQSSR
jgi:small subunit ribosomal protein S7